MANLTPRQGLTAANVVNIPLKWDPVWFRGFITWFLQNSDVRNAQTGSGIQITGQIQTPGQVTSGGINLSQLAPITADSVVGNATGLTAPPTAIAGGGDKSVLHQASASLSFSLIDHTYISDFSSAIVGSGGVLDGLGNAQGDILYRSASGWAALAPGTNGQVLISGGPSANPSWGAPPSGTGMVLIGSTVAGSSVATLTVSGIPATPYHHLYIVIFGRSTVASGGSNLLIQFNGDTGTNYDWELVQAFAGSASAGQAIGATAAQIGDFPGATATANRPGAAMLTVLGYAGTTFDKMGTALAGTNNGSTSGFGSQAYMVTWRPSTPAAITSVTISLPASANFVAGSALYVYGF